MRAFVVVLACVTVAACGGESDQTGGAEDQTAEDTLGDGETDGRGGSPPTAGDGEVGELTPPGSTNANNVPIPGCSDIDVGERLAEEEYELLLRQLDCVFDKRDQMPPEALQIARQARGMAESALASEETTDTGEEVEPGPETEPEPQAQAEPEADG